MLFDLRGRGRRRTVQVIYLSLAILMGGGLVLFGIGGEVQGGLFDGLSQNSGSASELAEERADNARKATQAQPRNARNFAVLAEAEFQLASQSEGYEQTTGAFTGEARERLEASKRAWERHLQLAGDRPNQNAAGTMRNALTALGDDAGAVRAQEIIIEGLGERAAFGDYAQLAVLAYQAGQSRKGDLSADRAKELAPKDQRKDLETSLEAQKAQILQQQAGAATGGAAGGATPAPAPAPAPSGG